MYRITVTFSAGHDTESIVFVFRANSLDAALIAAIKSVAQLGFKASDYTLAHSFNLMEKV